MKHLRSLFSLILLVLLLIGCVKQTFEPVDLPQQDDDIPLQNEKEVKLPKESKIAVYPTPAIWNRELITTVDQVVDPMGRYDF